MSEKEYIEREAALKILENSLTFSEIELDIGDFRKGCIAAIQDDISNIKHIPTADVVPRAEFDRVARELERVEALYFAKDTQLENAKAEVANKICCAIEKEIVAALESNYRARKEHIERHAELAYDTELLLEISGKINALRGIEGFVEELKKKYTESEK